MITKYPISNYGKFIIELAPIMNEKKMSKNRLCELTGLKFNALQRYYKNALKRVDLDILARICFALECNINDIIKYTPNN